jgi:hypothetical protein
MINYQETFQVYTRWITWTHNPCSHEFCNWYQNRCRIYLDEYPTEEHLTFEKLNRMIKTLRPY